MKLEIKSMGRQFLFRMGKNLYSRIGGRRFTPGTSENALTGLFAVESCKTTCGSVGQIN